MPVQRLLAAFPAAAVLAATAALPAVAQADYFSAEFEGAVIELVNLERANAGLGALSFDNRLQAAARAHAHDMASNGCFSHNSCDGGVWSERIYSYYPLAGIGENIAAGYSTAAAVVAGWMDSAGHRANILNPDWLGIGVGYYYLGSSDYRHYWVQNFGTLAPVPEPHAYAMLLAGLGLLGFAARRRAAAGPSHAA